MSEDRIPEKSQIIEQCWCVDVKKIYGQWPKSTSSILLFARPDQFISRQSIGMHFNGFRNQNDTSPSDSWDRRITIANSCKSSPLIDVKL